MTRVMAESRSKLRTNQLLLASFLIGIGHEANLVRTGKDLGGHEMAAWEFEPTDQIRGEIKRFENRSARVEPRAYYAKVKETRTAMFDFLDIDG